MKHVFLTNQLAHLFPDPDTVEVVLAVTLETGYCGETGNELIPVPLNDVALFLSKGDGSLRAVDLSPSCNEMLHECAEQNAEMYGRGCYAWDWEEDDEDDEDDSGIEADDGNICAHADLYTDEDVPDLTPPKNQGLARVPAAVSGLAFDLWVICDKDHDLVKETKKAIDATDQ